MVDGATGAAIVSVLLGDGVASPVPTTPSAVTDRSPEQLTSSSDVSAAAAPKATRRRSTLLTLNARRPGGSG